MADDPRAVLMRDIFDDPDDDLPRLVLGDWLADHGDPRGEFVQIDVRLAARVADRDERARLGQRRRELLAKHALRWLGPLVDVASGWEFRRGFVHLTLRGVKLLEGLATLGGDEFAWVTGVTVKELHHRQLRAAGVAERIAALPVLDLSNAHLGNDSVWRLITAPETRRLRHLDLSGCRIGDEGVSALAACPALARLRSLGLRRNRFGEAGVQALLDSSLLAGLRLLDLRGCVLPPETRDELRHRFGERLRVDRL